MRKIAAVLVFAMVTILTGAAHAAPLEITTGGIFSDTETRDIAGTFAGHGFFADGRTLGAGFVVASDLAAGTAFLPLFMFGSIQVGALTCSWVALPDPDSECGAGVQVTHPPIPTPDDLTVRSVRSAPFTATGQLVMPDATFDVVGRGTVEATWCPSGDCGFGPGLVFPHLFVGYTFSVPEPPSALLLISSFGVLGALFSARFLRDGRHRNEDRG